jgi:hypothetical protein
MAISQLPQAPFRQDRRIFPTPIIGDVLFSEVRDCTRALIPEYGTSHPDTNKWPDHKLVYVKTVDIERDGVFEFFYAAERENQDLYNFSSSYRNIIGNVGGREFRIVQRSYVTLRENFQPLDIPFGTVMPDIPEGKFEGVEYVFFDRQQQPIAEQELNALFVAEIHTYIETAFLEYKLSYTTTKSDVVPEKFQINIPQTTTEQIVEGLAEQPVLTATQLSVSEEQINPDIKVVRIVSREKPEDDISFIGGRAYVEGGPPANVIETYSKDEIEVDTGLLVVQSTVTPLGDGSSIKETVEVESWPVLKGSEFDFALNAQVVNTQQMVAPTTNFSEPNTSFKPINEDRSLKIVEEVPTDALEGYHISVPTRIDLRMPAVLKSINVLWAADESIGDGDSSGSGNNPDGANGFTLTTSAGMNGKAEKSARPTVNIEIETVFGSDISATVHFFYLNSENKPVSESSFLSRVNTVVGGNVQRWPAFKPRSHTITALGAAVSCNSNAQLSASVTKNYEGQKISGRSSAEGGSSSVNRSIDVINVPPTIHGPIAVNGGSSYTVVQATSQARARLEGDEFGDVNPVIKTNSASASVSVRPLSFPATSPYDIPRTGDYLVGSSAEPFKWGWLKCSATIIDASQFGS